MKTEFTDVSETQKTISIEIPPDVVDAEIDRIARGYAKEVRLPGFRPGKAPAAIVKQRFREQIHHDVMHGLVPRAVEEALQERGIEPVDSPNIKDVAIREGQPLTFTAAIQTVPPFDPGDLGTIALTRVTTTVTDTAVDQALQRLRERAREDGSRGGSADWRRRHRGGRSGAHRSRRQVGDAHRRHGHARLAGQPAGVRREPGRPEPGGPEDLRRGLPRRVSGGRNGRQPGRLCGDGEGRASPRAARAGRRVRQGPR